MTDAETKEDHAVNNARGWLDEIKRMVDALNSTSAEDNCGDDPAAEEIQQSVLSVLVRDGWREPYKPHNDEGPEEYEILLSTGGPALRIYGSLDQYNQPEDGASLQWQDWGTPWTNYPLDVDDSLAVDAFARQFYFGE